MALSRTSQLLKRIGITTRAYVKHEKELAHNEYLKARAACYLNQSQDNACH